MANKRDAQSDTYDISRADVTWVDEHSTGPREGGGSNLEAVVAVVVPETNAPARTRGCARAPATLSGIISDIRVEGDCVARARGEGVPASQARSQ